MDAIFQSNPSLAKCVETTTSGATLFPAVFHFNKTWAVKPTAA